MSVRGALSSSLFAFALRFRFCFHSLFPFRSVPFLFAFVVSFSLFPLRFPPLLSLFPQVHSPSSPVLLAFALPLIPLALLFWFFFALRFPCSHSLFPLPSTPLLLAFALPSSFFVFSLHFRSFLFAFLSSLFPLAFAFAWAVRGHAVFSSNLLPFAGQQMHKRNMR